jgi:hypothetical protein
LKNRRVAGWFLVVHCIEAWAAPSVSGTVEQWRSFFVEEEKRR